MSEETLEAQSPSGDMREVDVTITSNSELMVFQAESDTEAGIEFLDAYLPAGAGFHVVDSGRIVFPHAALANLKHAVAMAGLSLAERDQ